MIKFAKDGINQFNKKSHYRKCGSGLMMALLCMGLGRHETVLHYYQLPSKAFYGDFSFTLMSMIL